MELPCLENWLQLTWRVRGMGPTSHVATFKWRVNKFGNTLIFSVERYLLPSLSLWKNILCPSKSKWEFSTIWIEIPVRVGDDPTVTKNDHQRVNFLVWAPPVFNVWPPLGTTANATNLTLQSAANSAPSKNMDNLPSSWMLKEKNLGGDTKCLGDGMS